MSANPFGSENTKLNVCDDPLPDDGVTDTTVGLGGIVEDNATVLLLTTPAESVRE